LTNFAGQTRAGNYYFAPASFCQPTNVNPALNKCPMFYGQFGNVGRDSFHGPGQNVTNLALMKDIQIKEQMRIELRLESYNTFNHVNFNLPTADVNSRNFGRITGDTLGPRVVQLAGKFYF
jgi:hypothetical protein